MGQSKGSYAHQAGQQQAPQQAACSTGNSEWYAARCAPVASQQGTGYDSHSAGCTTENASNQAFPTENSSYHISRSDAGGFSFDQDLNPCPSDYEYPYDSNIDSREY